MVSGDLLVSEISLWRDRNANLHTNDESMLTFPTCPNLRLHMRSSETELVCHIGRKQGKTAGGKNQRKNGLKTKRKTHGKNSGSSRKDHVARWIQDNDHRDHVVFCFGRISSLACLSVKTLQFSGRKTKTNQDIFPHPPGGVWRMSFASCQCSRYCVPIIVCYQIKQNVIP